MFSVPDSTPPPSTPDSRRALRSQPSTTPAGPPPSNLTHKSFTPVGPPPSSVFTSSNSAGEGGARIPAPNFGPSKLRSAYLLGDATRNDGMPSAQSASRASESGNLFGFAVPDSSPPPRQIDREDDFNGREDAMDEDDDMASHVVIAPAQRALALSHTGLSTRTSRGSRRLGDSFGETVDLEQSAAITELDQVAKGLVAALPNPTLPESNSLIVETDTLLRRLYDEGTEDFGVLLSDTVGQLRSLWAGTVQENARSKYEPNAIGPGRNDSAFSKAQFVTDILLRLHHPPQSEAKPKLQLSASRFGRSSIASDSPGRHSTTFPKLLLDWLNQNHDPTETDLEDVLRQPAGFSAAEAFWDAVFSSLFRGKFTQAIRLLKGANFSVAESAKLDGYEDAGYDGRQLQQTDIAVERAIRLLESCPAVLHKDWNITGSDWALWRHSVRKAIEELEAQASGPSSGGPAFDESTRSNVFGISASSRKSENRLPSFIYESLNDMFHSLLGNSLEVVKSACDWVEAVIGMSVWWDGDDEEVSASSLAVSRRSVRRSQRSRLVDVAPSQAYQQRLRWAINYVMENEEEQLHINMSNPVEVVLACVFAGELEPVLAAMQRWSMTIAAATAEIASAGRWLPQKPDSRALIRGLDQSDLMVLEYGEDNRNMSKKDTILTIYADLLGDRQSMAFDESTKRLKGWNVAVQVLGRLDDEQLADERIGQLLDRLSLESEEEVEEVLALCDQLGLASQVKLIAERYADHLSATSNLYGPALVYYARAHSATKLRDVLDLLVSHCLVISKAFPALDECDATLQKLVRSPKDALDDMESVDPEAARLLSTCLSGYATLRRFYDIRDDESAMEFPASSRKEEAANALIAVIESANDSIDGGLYDPTTEVVVQVDGLLALLGETLVFLNGPSRILSVQQTFAVLRAAEDLQNAASRIYGECEALLQATLENFYDGSVPTNLSPEKSTQKQPQTRSLGRSQSSGLTGSQFSLLNGSGQSSQELAASSASSGSEMLVRKGAHGGRQAKVAAEGRGWDWRSGFARGTSGKDVLAVLRLALAKEVADGWMAEEYK